MANNAIVGNQQQQQAVNKPASGKHGNVLPLWGNEKTMNLNPMILTNVLSSPYFKVQLYELKTYHEVVDEIYFKVTHVEPWEKGSRKTAGQTGMCGGVRGVGTGGIVSTAFCLLYKLFTLKLTRKQVMGLITHTDSPYIRALGFMYIRYTQPPADLVDWFDGFLDDEETRIHPPKNLVAVKVMKEIMVCDDSCVSASVNTTNLTELDVKAGGGCVMTVGEMLRSFLTKLEWFSTLFPRIPVPVQKMIDQQLKARPRKVPEKEEKTEDSAGESGRQGERRRSRSPRRTPSPRRSPNRSRSRSHHRERRGVSFDRELERERDRQRKEREGKDRDRGDRDRDRERDRERDRGDHERRRSRSAERRSRRSSSREHRKEKERERDGDGDRSRRKERDHHHERDRDRDRERDKDKDRDKDRERERERSKDKRSKGEAEERRHKDDREEKSRHREEKKSKRSSRSRSRERRHKSERSSKKRSRSHSRSRHEQPDDRERERERGRRKERSQSRERERAHRRSQERERSRRSQSPDRRDDGSP